MGSPSGRKRSKPPSVWGKPEGKLRYSEGGQCRLIHPCSFPSVIPEPPKVSLTPAPLVWAAPGEAPPELLCLVSHFYPPEGLEVEWELRGGPEDSFQKAKGQSWLSALRHHSDGSVSLSAHLQPPPVTAAQHGAHYACRVHHPSLPALGRSAQVTLEVAGKNQRNQEGGRVLRRGWGAGEDVGELTLAPPTRSLWTLPGGWHRPLPFCLSAPRTPQSAGLGR